MALFTKLPESIDTESEAKDLLLELFSHGELYHPEDDAQEVIFERKVEHGERARLNILFEQIRGIENFDPCEYIMGEMLCPF